MDEFYHKENIEIFRKWVYYQIISHEELKIEFYDERTYKINYKDKVARFVVWPNGIIEEAIVENDEVIFYLHYEFYNFSYATDLFYRLINKLLEENKVKKKKILLCCSGGMTTGYFATRANQFCKLNQLPYIIDANSINKAMNIYQEYEMILLAPQVHYQEKMLRDKLKGCMIIIIEATTFATYDCAKLIKLIQSYQGDENER
ncbi:MAG: hypothetical protein U0L85_01020 [Bacilli bacterium]|nr:hypothetical protein [Bacilli bacterium]